MSEKIRSILRKNAGSERGQGLVEYALIIAVVSIAIATSLTALKTDISGTYNAAGDAIDPSSGSGRFDPPPPPAKSGGTAGRPAPVR